MGDALRRNHRPHCAGRGRRWADRVSGSGRRGHQPQWMDAAFPRDCQQYRVAVRYVESPRTCCMPYAQPLPLPLPLPLVPLCAEWDPGELRSVQWAGGRQDPAPLPLWQRRHQPHPHPRLTSNPHPFHCPSPLRWQPEHLNLRRAAQHSRNPLLPCELMPPLPVELMRSRRRRDDPMPPFATS